jgi:uncharacterized membrane protein
MSASPSRSKFRRARQRRREEMARARRGALAILWVFIGAGLTLVIVILYVSAQVGPRTDFARVGPAEAELLPAPGPVRLPLATFTDSRARFYRYPTAPGDEVRFFVVMDPKGVIHAAFDACLRCYGQGRGFRQAGEVMVCNSCRGRVRSADLDTLEYACTPVPIRRTLDGEDVLLLEADLRLGDPYF